MIARRQGPLQCLGVESGDPGGYQVDLSPEEQTDHLNCAVPLRWNGAFQLVSVSNRALADGCSASDLTEGSTHKK